MLARTFETGSERQDRSLVEALGRHHRDDTRFPFGQSSGLIDDERVDLLKPLQCLGILDQDASSRALAHAHHDRHRGRQAQRARARDDQDRNGSHQCIGESGRRSPDHPGNERHDRDKDNGRNEPSGDNIGEPLDRRAAALRFRDHVDNAREHRVRTDFLGAHDEATCPVDRAAYQLGALLLLDRHGLASHHRLVDRAAALDHHAVHWHAIARAHAQAIADMHLLKRNLVIIAVVADTTRRFWREVQQGADGAPRLLARPQFENLAEENEHRDYGSRFIIDRNDSAFLPQSFRKKPRREGGDKAVKIGGTDAQRDQTKHVKRSVAHRCPAADEKRPTRPEHDWRSKQKLEPN